MTRTLPRREGGFALLQRMEGNAPRSQPPHVPAVFSQMARAVCPASGRSASAQGTITIVPAEKDVSAPSSFRSAPGGDSAYSALSRASSAPPGRRWLQWLRKSRSRRRAGVMVAAFPEKPSRRQAGGMVAAFRKSRSRRRAGAMSRHFGKAVPPSGRGDVAAFRKSRSRRRAGARRRPGRRMPPARARKECSAQAAGNGFPHFATPGSA